MRSSLTNWIGWRARRLRTPARRLLSGLARYAGDIRSRIAAILAMAALLLSLLILQETELRRERADYSYLLTTNNWAVSQLEFELVRFLAALDRHRLGEPDGDPERLMLRFDVMWSRLPILTISEQTTEVRKIEGAMRLLKDFEDMLIGIESQVAALLAGDRGRYGAIRSELLSWLGPLRDLTMEVYVGDHFKRLVERTEAGHRRAAIYQWAMLVVVVLLASFLAVEVLRSVRRAKDHETARRAAEEASLAKSTFLATMSHELRTPLNAIMGFAEIQERQIFGPMPERYLGYAHDIHASAAHLLAVLSDVLDMARMDARRLALHEETFDPADALRSAVRMVAVAGAAGVRVTVHASVAGLRLRADERLFRQIVVNLLSNAVKFTPMEGRIEVTLTTARGGRLVLRVEDTGPGIAPELLPRIAEPFFQADQSYARRHQGTGLGLSLVKGFVELHGGTLRIDSELGAGTRVTVEFPAVRLCPAADRDGGSLRPAGLRA